MGKAGRIACIFTPWALTVASFICLLLIEIGGWSSGSSALNDLYFFQADFSNLTTADAGKLANSTTLTAALELAQSTHSLRDVYQIHLWNYCSSNTSSVPNGVKIDYCSDRQANFVFDPVQMFMLNATGTATSSATDPATSNLIQSGINAIKNDTQKFENEVLGKTGAAALNTYRTVARWMFIAYQVSFWSTLATIVFALLAIFSRWGSLITWILAVVSTLFTFAAVLTSTILFGALVGALKVALDPYHISLSLSTTTLAVAWIGVATSVLATFFWLFSVCCCSGRSNPHHRSNKGGLWNAEPKGQGYGNYGRGMAVEKNSFGSGAAGGYQRVASPGFGGPHDDHVPLTQYPAPQGYPAASPYEPYRRS